MRSRAFRQLSAMPAGNEQDPLADKLFFAISDAVMAAVTPFAARGLDMTNPEHQRSVLRAAGATMAVLALSGRLAGMTDEQSAAAVLNGFNSKFDPSLPTPDGGQPS